MSKSSLLIFIMHFLLLCILIILLLIIITILGILIITLLQQRVSICNKPGSYRSPC